MEKAELGETAGTDKDYEKRLQGIVDAVRIPEERRQELRAMKKEELLRAILWNGAKRRYIPDFLIHLTNDKTLVLEIKGEDSEQNRAKLAAMSAWVDAVNGKGGFGLVLRCRLRDGKDAGRAGVAREIACCLPAHAARRRPQHRRERLVRRRIRLGATRR